MKITDGVISDYLRFKIGHKEVTNKSYQNRKASDFYRLLKQDAIRYGVSIIEVLKRDAYFVMKGEFISLLK